MNERSECEKLTSKFLLFNNFVIGRILQCIVDREINRNFNIANKQLILKLYRKYYRLNRINMMQPWNWKEDKDATTR